VVVNDEKDQDAAIRAFGANAQACGEINRIIL